MSYNLVINSSNVVGNQNSTFVYTFLGSSSLTIKEGSKICVSSLSIPYSFFNVTQFYNNQTFSFNWRVGVTTTTYNITLPAGFYLVSDISNFLENYFIQNGMYLVDSAGNNVYYLELAYNTTYYATQILSFAVPTSLPTGYVQPSSWLGYPSVANTPQLILSSNNFKNILGFSAGSYPPTPQSTNYSITSNVLPPVGSNINAVVLTCSLVNNNVTIPSDILDSFPINSTFGSNIVYAPSFEKWVKMNAGTYNSITIRMLDQNLNIINANDSNVSITLLIQPPP
jgi:hypothetical protein